MSYVLYYRIQYDYPDVLIGNMDETPVYFEMPSTVTIDETGARTIGIRTCGYEKAHYTVVFVCLANSVKLPL